MKIAKTFSEILKFNPYHGYHGYFTTSDKATSFTYAPGKSKAHDNAILRQKKKTLDSLRSDVHDKWKRVMEIDDLPKVKRDKKNKEKYYSQQRERKAEQKKLTSEIDESKKEYKRLYNDYTKNGGKDVPKDIWEDYPPNF